ncbi:NFX1-type zinc finger-containing protein 1 [Eublepharis macularius]|uniref:NFX1-type zinc finger-containing protein 1 n=1 Tax=Eublepharis macularius TaxID=481883 RepID=A0AA97L1R6_EUBMA|nr:NFX1-type zinc finger-containing protein 1 [Eublepharis macularius]
MEPALPAFPRAGRGAAMEGARRRPARRQQQQQPPGAGRAHRVADVLQEGPDHGQRGPGRPRREAALPRGGRGHLEIREERHVGSGRIVLPQGRVAVDGARRPWSQQAGGDSQAGQNPGGGSRTLRSGQASHFPQDPRHAHGQVRRVGLKFLEGLLQKDASEVAITLASSSGLKEALSQTALRPGFVQLLCQVLRKACCSQMDRQSIQQLMCAVKESTFLRVCLPQYVAGMLTEATPAVRHQYPEHIDNIVVLVQEMASMFPASSIQNISMLMSALPAAVNALRASGVDFTEEMENRLEKVQVFVQHLQEKRRGGTLKVDSCTTMHPLGAEQGADYRTMPVYPTYNEVHSNEKTFLRPNIISQKYESTAIYLDTQFRLLREDFVRPLREGILLFLQSFEDKGLRKKKFDDIRVYFDARILGPLCTATGIDYKVQFDTRPLKFVRWENSKRLLYGSLVCLSKDNFETFLFATVSHRDSRDLQQGFIHLSFNKHSRPLLAEVQPADSFLMVETTAYFEAYQHVLKGLQALPEAEVPFQDYIVKCEPQVRAPAYLERGSTYDLRPLLKAPAADQHLGAPAGNRIDVLDPAQWPAADVLGLDASQVEALQLALTKELAIIQGPPGTGKTYVGLKIVQALLANEALREKSPILVVCYTNHALDQFLEGIYKFQKSGIVRVGGRSSSEVLRQFTLRELRNKFRHELRPHLRWGYNEVTIQMRESAEQLEKFAALLECSLKGILHERHLQSHISESHWNSLLRGWDTEWLHPQASLMVEWLRLGLGPFSCSDVEPNGEEHAGTPEEEEQGAESDLLLIEEEAELIQAERLLDSDEAARPRPPKKEPPRAARAQLENLLLAMKLEEEDGEEQEGQRTASGLGNGGWEVQRGQKKRMKQKVKGELRKLEGMTVAQAEAIQDVWQLDLGSRWQLYRHWLQKYQAEIRNKIQQHEQTYQSAAERLAELRLHEDLYILEKAQIVGMTTTGAARYHQGLQKVAPRVVLVEEAAEVLEAHTITTLSKACQHLVLIGDHQQLRPSANVYDLAKNFNLEVSLFERLVKVGLPFVRLNFQHRMRPEIAHLLTPHIYQELANHPSVLQYDPIQGVSSSLFFVEHDFPEQEIQEGKSHQNTHEAQFVVALCKYLLCQNYRPSQITILTTYTGQLLCLRRLLPAKTFQGVKVHVVDKYQGEENDIVLLSLVRSNLEGRVGFLQIPNRVCVALSRAKKGLYCIGNMAMLGQVPLWSKIIHTLREKGHIGHSLLLCCQNHPETRTAVASAVDFSKVPEGGCSRPCDYRLSCGHVCPRACHPYDPQHKEVECLKACQRVLCANGHRCPKLCSEPCGQCLVIVPKTLPRCGHLQDVPCSTPEEAFCCQEPCWKVLRCGHSCRQTCGQACTKHCPEMVQVTLRCQHSQMVQCCTAADVECGRPVLCQVKCLGTLECGHACPGSCHSCSSGRFHEQCRRPCERLLICAHKCLEPCTSNCPPCQKPCENRCSHSRCHKKCGEPCTPCMEPCEWRCRHYQCSKLCSEPCDRPRCDVPCPKQLLCGHPCAGMCGEPCPPKCPVCHHEELAQIFFGFEDEPGARFVLLEDCGHIFESTGLDHYMDEGAGAAAVRLRVCPGCQTPIRRNLRYSTLVRRSLQEVEQVKEQIQGSPAEAAATRHRLQAALRGKGSTLEQHLPEQYERLQKALEEPSLCSRSLGVMENQLSFFVRLADLRSSLSQLDPSEREGVKRRLAEVGQWLERPRLTFTPQQLLDLQSEFQRLGFLLDLLATCRAAKEKVGAPVAELLSTMRQVLEGVGRFTLEDEKFVKGTMEEVKAALPKSGLGLSDAERVEIVAAVTGSRQGHWFKCRNGHIYAIGDCGGAMEESRCPECREVIGGTNHRLDPSNQLASEMDGAAHPAWSDTANALLPPAEWHQLH